MESVLSALLQKCFLKRGHKKIASFDYIKMKNFYLSTESHKNRRKSTANILVI